MTSSETASDTGYVLRRPAASDERRVESRTAPDLPDELLELREALEKELAERDREVAEERKRSCEAEANVVPIDMASRVRSAIRTAFDRLRSSDDLRQR